MREPEYAERRNFSVNEAMKCHGRTESLHGGVGGASEMKRFMGTTAVDRIPNTRILQVPSHVDILTTVN